MKTSQIIQKIQLLRRAFQYIDIVEQSLVAFVSIEIKLRHVHIIGFKINKETGNVKYRVTTENVYDTSEGHIDDVEFIREMLNKIEKICYDLNKAEDGEIQEEYIYNKAIFPNQTTHS